MISHLEQRSSSRESQGWFFFCPGSSTSQPFWAEMAFGQAQMISWLPRFKYIFCWAKGKSLQVQTVRAQHRPDKSIILAKKVQCYRNEMEKLKPNKSLFLQFDSFCVYKAR